VRLSARRRRGLTLLSLARAAALLVFGVGIGVASASSGWLARVLGRAPTERAPRGSAVIPAHGYGAVRPAAEDVRLPSPPPEVGAPAPNAPPGPGAPAANAAPGPGAPVIVAPSPPPAPAGSGRPAHLGGSRVALAPAAVRPPVALGAPAPTAPPSPERGGAGSALLGQALVTLRRERDPGGALALLDQYLAEFPDGALVPEVTATRVEALLARGDAAAALRALDALPSPLAPLDRRLRALRGELRAQAGRCGEATRDFSEVLHAAPADAVDERALRGRAACAALAGDQPTLRRDLEAYVAAFPDRPFVAEARARLEALPAEP
jgi:hypothetical protein